MSDEIISAVMDTDQASKYLGVAKTELANSRITGSLSGLTPPSYIRIGKRVRYPLKGLNDWLEEQPTYRTIAEQEAANGYPAAKKQKV